MLRVELCLLTSAILTANILQDGMLYKLKALFLDFSIQPQLTSTSGASQNLHFFPWICRTDVRTYRHFLRGTEDVNVDKVVVEGNADSPVNLVLHNNTAKIRLVIYSSTS